MPDPVLTEEGEKQAVEVVTNPVWRDTAMCAGEHQAQLIVSSPMRRTLQTSLGFRRSAHLESIPILAHPDLQEVMPVPHDTGSPLQTLLTEFPEDVDFSLVAEAGEEWYNYGFDKKPLPFDVEKEEIVPEGHAALQARLARFTRWLASRPEDRIIVTGHGLLFLYLVRCGFGNCAVYETTFHCDSGEWEITKTIDGDMPVQNKLLIPAFNKDGQPMTARGSPQILSNLETITKYSGEVAAKESAKRAGISFPPL